VTATADSAAARDFYYKGPGATLPIITDGGMTTGGDICKALASGADAVHDRLGVRPCPGGAGTRLPLGHGDPAFEPAARDAHPRRRVGPLEQILFGPAFTEDGTLNLVGAIRTCMGSVGAMNIKELQQTELIIAPPSRPKAKCSSAPKSSAPLARSADAGTSRQLRCCSGAQPPTSATTFALQNIRLREEAKPPTMITDV